MAFRNKSLTPKERYELIGKLIEEIKLRKYSYRVGIISVVKRFLRSGLEPQQFLLKYYSDKSRSTFKLSPNSLTSLRSELHFSSRGFRNTPEAFH